MTELLPHARRGRVGGSNLRVVRLFPTHPTLDRKNCEELKSRHDQQPHKAQLEHETNVHKRSQKIKRFSCRNFVLLFFLRVKDSRTGGTSDRGEVATHHKWTLRNKGLSLKWAATYFKTVHLYQDALRCIFVYAKLIKIKYKDLKNLFNNFLLKRMLEETTRTYYCNFFSSWINWGVGSASTDAWRNFFLTPLHPISNLREEFILRLASHKTPGGQSVEYESWRVISQVRFGRHSWVPIQTLQFNIKLCISNQQIVIVQDRWKSTNQSREGRVVVDEPQHWTTLQHILPSTFCHKNGEDLSLTNQLFPSIPSPVSANIFRHMVTKHQWCSSKGIKKGRPVSNYLPIFFTSAVSKYNNRWLTRPCFDTTGFRVRQKLKSFTNNILKVLTKQDQRPLPSSPRNHLNSKLCTSAKRMPSCIKEPTFQSLKHRQRGSIKATNLLHQRTNIINPALLIHDRNNARCGLR